MDKKTKANLKQFANACAVDNLTEINELLRSIESVAEQMDDYAQNLETEGANRMECIAIALRALTFRAGILVDDQLRCRDASYRGWLECFRDDHIAEVLSAA